jgi:acetyltransferase
MSIIVRPLTLADYPLFRPALIDLLIDAVDHGASVNFFAPMDHALAESFWDRVVPQIDSGEREIVLALEGDHLVGSAQLALAMQPNGRHRAEVQKVLVHSTQRRRGIGLLLMITIEACARQHQRTLLVLDTEADSDANGLYLKAGYTLVGTIPDFAHNARGVLSAAAIYYKFVG